MIPPMAQAAASAAADDEDAACRAFEGEEGVFLCFFHAKAGLFIHDVNGSANEILRKDATLPSPYAKD